MVVYIFLSRAQVNKLIEFVLTQKKIPYQFISTKNNIVQLKEILFKKPKILLFLFLI